MGAYRSCAVLGNDGCSTAGVRNDGMQKLEQKTKGGICALFVWGFYRGDVMDMIKKSRGELEAVFTVEAALILPLVIGCLLAIIFMTFYWHDYVVLKASAAEAVICRLKEDMGQRQESLFYFRQIRWKEVQEEMGVLEGGGTRYQIFYQTEGERGLAVLLGGLLGDRSAAGEMNGLEGNAEYICSSPVKLIWMFQIMEEESGGDRGDGDQISVGKKSLLYADKR